jgi:putative lipoic acid-binding regulatory protein
MDSKELARLIELLDQNYDWPDYYQFKFIVKVADRAKIEMYFRENDQIDIKPSKNGNYLSISVKRLISHSQEVLAVYSEVSKIEGVITL